jgi:hypothetical protein
VTPGAAADGSRLTLYTASIPGMPPATLPHVLVDATNLQLDPARLGLRDELRHRPGYLRVEGGYLDWAPGALLGAGTSADGALAADSLPRDHLRDVLGSLVVGNPPPPAATVDEPVLCVAREPREHTNPFHAVTDLLNAFLATRVLGLDPAATRVLLLDPLPPGPLDVAFRRLFSRGHPLLRARELPGRALLRRAVLVPPGYSSFLWARQHERDGGCGPVGLLVDFGRYLKLAFDAQPPSRDVAAPVAVRVALRRPYPGSGRGAFLRRRFADESGLLAALRGVSGVEVQAVDFARQPFAAQVAAAAQAELLVAAHGAAFVHLLWADEAARAIEVVARPAAETYRLYPNLGEWSARPVVRCEARERLGIGGTFLEPPLAELQALVERLAAEIRAARAKR